LVVVVGTSRGLIAAHVLVPAHEIPALQISLFLTRSRLDFAGEFGASGLSDEQAP
jgi:hypothetical protein